MRRLQLLILAQALEDILLYELGLPLVGSPRNVEEAYENALAYIGAYPTLINRWKSRDKRTWLNEVRDARA